MSDKNKDHQESYRLWWQFILIIALYCGYLPHGILVLPTPDESYTEHPSTIELSNEIQQQVTSM